MPLPDHVKELAAKVSNWGRWGAADRRGTLNFITPEAAQRGAAAVRRGVSFALTIPFDEDGPQTGAAGPGRTNPQREMVLVNAPITGDPADFTTSDDRFDMGVQAATHWDSIAHVGYEGLLYNGVPDTDVSDAGSATYGIETFGPIVTRGVLLDVARVHGVDYFDDAYAIGAHDLEAAARRGGVTVESGDIVLIRTGQMHWLRQGDKQRYNSPTPGPGLGSIEWFHDHQVAAVATDTLAFEVYPCEDEAAMLPVHMLDLRDMGLVQGQLWNLDELAADCAADGQHDFLLAATPLPLTHAVGGPVAPTATK